jgi:hypothetical protein
MVSCFLSADDLAHLRAVKLDKHTEFAESNKAHSYFVSVRFLLSFAPALEHGNQPPASY